MSALFVFGGQGASEMGPYPNRFVREDFGGVRTVMVPGLEGVGAG